MEKPYPSPRQPLSSIENVPRQKSVSIPHLKRTPQSKANVKVTTAKTKYDELRCLLDSFVLDRAAKAVANRLVNELEHEETALRARCRELELNDSQARSSISKSFIPIPGAVLQSPNDRDQHVQDCYRNATDENQGENLSSSLKLSSISLLAEVEVHQMTATRRSSRRASITAFAAPASDDQENQTESRRPKCNYKSEENEKADSSAENYEGAGKQNKSPRNHCEATPTGLKQHYSAFFESTAGVTMRCSKLLASTPTTINNLDEIRSRQSNQSAKKSVLTQQYCPGKERDDNLTKFNSASSESAVAYDCDQALARVEDSRTRPASELQQSESLEIHGNHSQECDDHQSYENPDNFGILMFDSSIEVESDESYYSSAMSVPPDDFSAMDSTEPSICPDTTEVQMSSIEAPAAGRRMSARFRIRPNRFLAEGDDADSTYGSKVQRAAPARKVQQEVTKKGRKQKDTVPSNPQQHVGLGGILASSASPVPYQRNVSPVSLSREAGVSSHQIENHSSHVSSVTSLLDPSTLNTADSWDGQESYFEYNDEMETNSGVLRWCDEDPYTVPPLKKSSVQKVSHDVHAADEEISSQIVFSYSAVVNSSRTISVGKFMGSNHREGTHRSSNNTYGLIEAFKMISSSGTETTRRKLSSVGLAFSSTLLSFLLEDHEPIRFHSAKISSFVEDLVAFASCLQHPNDDVISKSLSNKDKKCVHFCDIDGSSVDTPGKDNALRPALCMARRLVSILSGMEKIVHSLFPAVHMQGCSSTQETPLTLEKVLRCCQQIEHPSSAMAASVAVRETLSLMVKPGDIMAMAGMLASELLAAKELKCPRLSGVRTVLRHRIAWMATALLRAQLRWLLDPPPAHVSVPCISGYPAVVTSRSNIHTMITLCENFGYIADTCKKSRRKSEVVLIDRTVMHPAEMTLSALLTHALRQIYDAFSAAVASSPSQEENSTSVDSFVTEFLTAMVRSTSDDEGGPALQGLENTHPQHALAAVRAKEFIMSLFAFPAVQESVTKESVIWSIVLESAGIIVQHGMSEDRHLCLLAGGLDGLTRFAGRRLLSDDAQLKCVDFVKTLAEYGAEDDAVLVNSSFIYDFPTLIAAIPVN